MINNSKISFILYTTGDFPYGKAPENLVREFMLGLKVWNRIGIVYRMRGRSYSGESVSDIQCRNFVVDSFPHSNFKKTIIILLTLILIPFNVVYVKFKYNPKVIVLYGLEYSYFVVPFLLITKILRIKLFRFITDDYDKSTIYPVWWKRPKFFFYRIQKNHIDKYLNGLICLTTLLQESAIRSGVKRSKVLLIPHFIDINSFKYVQRDNYMSRKKRISFCGTPHEPNGIFDLIEAFKLVREDGYDVELYIIGEPLTCDFNKIKILLKSHEDFYVITGYKEKKDVVVLLNESDILLNPRKSGLFAESGFPTKLGEYFATKKPIVSTCVGDIRKYFSNKKELMLVEPNNVKEMARAIIYLLENPEEASNIGMRGYSWALENLDYIRNAEKVKDFLFDREHGQKENTLY